MFSKSEFFGIPEEKLIITITNLEYNTKVGHLFNNKTIVEKSEHSFIGQFKNSYQVTTKDRIEFFLQTGKYYKKDFPIKILVIPFSYLYLYMFLYLYLPSDPSLSQ